MPPCAVADCGRVAAKRHWYYGMCPAHYWRWRDSPDGVATRHERAMERYAAALLAAPSHGLHADNIPPLLLAAKVAQLRVLHRLKGWEHP